MKLGIDARAGVPECWLVNLLEGCVEVYLEPVGDAYKSVRPHMPDEAIAPEWAVPASGVLKLSPER